MILKFKAATLCDLFRLKLILPQERLKSLTLSFKSKKKVNVWLEVDYLSDMDIENDFNDLMKKTLQLRTTPKRSIPKGNAYKFKAEYFDDVKRWISAMPKKVVQSITIFNKLEPYFDGIPEIDVLVYTADGITLNDMRDYLHLVEEGHVMWESVQRAQHYTGERTEFLGAIKYFPILN